MRIKDAWSGTLHDLVWDWVGAYPIQIIRYLSFSLLNLNNKKLWFRRCVIVQRTFFKTIFISILIIIITFIIVIYLLFLHLLFFNDYQGKLSEKSMILIISSWMVTDIHTDIRTDGGTKPHIEMRGPI